MKFSSDASVVDPAISVHFEERLGHWILSLQGGNEKKVLASCDKNLKLCMCLT